MDYRYTGQTNDSVPIGGSIPIAENQESERAWRAHPAEAGATTKDFGWRDARLICTVLVTSSRGVLWGTLYVTHRNLGYQESFYNRRIQLHPKEWSDTCGKVIWTWWRSDKRGVCACVCVFLSKLCCPILLPTTVVVIQQRNTASSPLCLVTLNISWSTAVNSPRTPPDCHTSSKSWIRVLNRGRVTR